MSNGGSVVCDANQPNPATDGAYGADVHLLTGASVQLLDPYAGASPVYNTIIIAPGGRLVTDTDSTVYNTLSTGTAVLLRNGATASISGTVHAIHDNVRGIDLDRDASLTVEKGGRIETEGNNGAAIFIGGEDTSVVLDGSVATSGGNAPGIAVRIIGPEDVLTSDVSISGDGSITTSGPVSRGIYALSGYGAVTISMGRVSTTGVGSTAIQAVSLATSVTVGDVTTKGEGAAGVEAVSYGGSATVVSTGTVTTSGKGSDGVVATAYARTAYGVSASATVNNLSTSGDDSPGVFVQALPGPGAGRRFDGEAYAAVNGALSTSGDHSAGVSVSAPAGIASVANNGSIETGGVDSPGIFASAAASVIVSGTGSVFTAGDYSGGIVAANSEGPIDVEAASVTTAGSRSYGVGTFSFRNDVGIKVESVSTRGDESAGVVAIGTYGNVTVAAGTITTSGKSSDGIYAYSHDGAVDVTATKVTVTGSGSRGIYAESYSGTVSVTGAATSVNAPAILAAAYNNTASVTVTGHTETTHGNAIVAYGYAGTAVEVTASGSVTGSENAIVISTPTISAGEGGAGFAALAVPAQGRSVVVNAGTVTGGSGYAVFAEGASVSVTNSGTINGALRLTDSNDSVTNAKGGLFNATKDSDFGAGADSFANAGTLAIQGRDVTFLGLETFRNSGLVTLANGRVGDSFTLPGNLVGAGGSVALDVTLGGTHPGHDQFVVEGAATGSNLIRITNASHAAPALLTASDGVTLVTTGPGSSAGAFAAAPATQDQGFIHYDIASRAKAGGGYVYNLVGEAGAPVFRAIKILEGAQSLWYKSADAVSAHATSLRDAIWSGATPPARGLWIQAFGAVDKRDSALGGYDVSYRQDYFGGQLGADLGTLGDGGGFAFGVTGGYISSRLNFSGSADRARYDAFNVGLYGTYVSGGLFVNGLAKIDVYRIASTGADAGYFDRFHGKGYGLQGEIGYRFGSDAFFAEPVASLAFVRIDLDDLVGAGAVVDFDKADGLRGKLGLRGGASTHFGASKGVFYASANYVHEFRGEDGIRFLSGGYDPNFSNRRIKGYAQATLGVNITMPGGVSGFIEANGDASDHYKGGGGRAGATFKF